MKKTSAFLFALTVGLVGGCRTGNQPISTPPDGQQTPGGRQPPGSREQIFVPEINDKGEMIFQPSADQSLPSDSSSPTPPGK